ncbi:DNA-binding protein [Sulfolobales archaeon HS-7]|nr:DNA-binding protein [Sulfolobales archaeon HS-7]
MRLTPPILWRSKGSFYQLVASKCEECGKFTFPVQSVCMHCGSSKVIQEKLSGRGKVVSFTVNYQHRTGFEKEMPQIIGLIELEEGITITAPIVEVSPDELKEGTEVTACLRRARADSTNGLIQYIFKFRPV